MIRRLRCALFVGALAITAQVAAQTPSPPKPSKDANITCPYLRQQRIDRHACQIADPDMGREVLDNLKRLKQADNLLELAKDLAQDGFLIEAMECCDHAADLCPGSPCAERAADSMLELALRKDTTTTVAERPKERKSKKPVITPEQIEEAWERIWFAEMPSGLMPDWPRLDVFANDEEPGVELLVSGLMKACHLLMNQGMQHEAAELARQAYALDPQRVQADPLIYKMHLLAESPVPQPAGASEASEPPACPYCPTSGKPIGEVVPEKTPPADNYELEVRVNASGVRLCADCSLSSNVYHVRYKHGRLAIWKTTDAGKTKP